MVAALTGGHEAELVASLEEEDNANSSNNTLYYLLSAAWWNAWRQFSGFQLDAAVKHRDQRNRPGPIDNKDLINQHASSADDLKPDLEEGQHFVTVPETTWAKLQEWYGGGPSIPRPAIVEGACGGASKRARVVVYPIKVNVHYLEGGNKSVALSICKTLTVGDLKAKACAALDLDADEVSLSNYFYHVPGSSLEGYLAVPVSEADILDGQDVLLTTRSKAKDSEEDESSSAEVPPLANDVTNRSSTARPAAAPSAIAPGAGSSFFGTARTVGSGGGSGSGVTTRNGLRLGGYTEDSVQQRTGAQPGLVGLSNLGNTCFMNSSLQCLAHTVPLMRCFLTRQYKNDLNKTNPLGLKGELAEAFGGLMNSLWSPNTGYLTPRGFKAKIGMFAPQFSGYQQHDSQEFLAFLLDGLHEDLNRIKAKPYVEEKDIPGRSDDEVAAEAWSNYRLRNDSVIVDHFQGMYKSKLDCPACGNASTKFDPFMYLSLPLPESRVRTLTVVLLTMDGSTHPVLYSVDVTNSGTVRDLYTSVVKLSDLHLAGSYEQCLLAAKVTTAHGHWSSAIATCPDPKARIADVLDSSAREPELFIVYYYPDIARGPAAGLEQVVVFQRRARRSPTGTVLGAMTFFAAPLVLFVPPEEVPAAHHIHEQAPAAQYAPSRFWVSPEAPIIAHIHSALAPFRIKPTDGDTEQQPGAGPSAQGAGASSVAGDVACATGLPMPGTAASAAPAGTAAAGERQRAINRSGGARTAAACGDTHTGGASKSSKITSSAEDMDWVDVACGVGTTSPSGSLKAPTPPAAERSTSPHHVREASYVAEFAPGSPAPPRPRGAACGGDSLNVSRPSSPGGVATSEAQQLDIGTELMGRLAAAAADEPPGAHRGAWDDSDDRNTASRPRLPGAEQFNLECDDSMQPGTPDTGEGGGISRAGNRYHDDTGQAATCWSRPAAAQGLLQPPISTVSDADNENEPVGTGSPRDRQDSYESLTACGPAPPAVEPFDMWAQHKAAAAAASFSHPTFELRLASEKGTPDFQTYLTKPIPGKHRNLVLDWVEAGGCGHWTPPPLPQQLYAATGISADTQHNHKPPSAPGSISSAFAYNIDAMAMPVEHESAAAHRERLLAGPGAVSLAACVEAFLQPEQLSEADSWYCPRCKTHVQADKKLDLWRLPEVLVVHLKRFSYTRYHRDKLETSVDFPLEGLDLSQYLLQDQDTSPIYDCFAVSNHFGSLGGGHYTAFCKMHGSGGWHCFDDSHVSSVSDPSTEVRSPAAYVLFYRRRHETCQEPPNLLESLLEASRLQQTNEPSSSSEGHPDQDRDLLLDGGTGTSYSGNYNGSGEDNDLVVASRSNAVVVAGQLIDSTVRWRSISGCKSGDGAASKLSSSPQGDPGQDMFAFDDKSDVAENDDDSTELIKAQPDDTEDDLYGTELVDVGTAPCSPTDCGLERMACSPT